MSNYNPFEKGIHELTIDDLNALRFVSEGWYIEYKQELSKADAIAKSISALANSYGGWIFYGVAEESKENSVAGSFPGIAQNEIDGALQRIRQAVATKLNPDCHYEVVALYGPSEALNLEAGRAIICVSVPQSLEAPHIHSKGVIYRRVADGSEPVPENDRHMIEKMFDRSKATIDLYKEWVSEDPELSKAETDNPHVRIIISTHPWKKPRPTFHLNIERAREALGADKKNFRSVTFDTFYSSTQGIVARQCGGSDPTTTRLTWNIYPSLSGDVSLPLQMIDLPTRRVAELLSKFETGSEFASILTDSKADNLRLVDMNVLFHVIMGIVQSHRALLKTGGLPCEFYIKIKLINAWRIIPFLDANFYLDHVKKNGIPLCLTEECINPPGSHPDTFLLVKDIPDVESDQISVALQAINIFTPIAEAFGIPMKELWLNYSSETTTIYSELIAAGERSAALGTIRE